MEKQYKLIICKQGEYLINIKKKGLEALELSKKLLNENLNEFEILVDHITLWFTQSEILNNELLTNIFKNKKEDKIGLLHKVDILEIFGYEYFKWEDNGYVQPQQNNIDSVKFLNTLSEYIKSNIVSKKFFAYVNEYGEYITSYINNISKSMQKILSKEDVDNLYDKTYSYPYVLKILEYDSSYSVRETVTGIRYSDFVKKLGEREFPSNSIYGEYKMYFSQEEVDNNSTLKKIFSKTSSVHFSVPEEVDVKVENFSWELVGGEYKIKSPKETNEKLKIIDKYKIFIKKHISENTSDFSVLEDGKIMYKGYIFNQTVKQLFEEGELEKIINGSISTTITNDNVDNKYYPLNIYIKNNLSKIIDKLKEKEDDYYFSKNIMWFIQASKSPISKFKYLKGSGSYYDLITINYLDRNIAIPVPVLGELLNIPYDDILYKFFGIKDGTRDDYKFL